MKKFNLLGTKRLDDDGGIGLETVSVAVEPFYEGRGFFAPPNTDMIVTNLHWLPDVNLYCLGVDINLDRVNWWMADLDLPSKDGRILFVTMEPVTRKEPGRWLRVDVHAKLRLGKAEAIRRAEALGLKIVKVIEGCDRDGDAHCQLILRDRFGNMSHTA